MPIAEGIRLYIYTVRTCIGGRGEERNRKRKYLFKSFFCVLKKYISDKVYIIILFYCIPENYPFIIFIIHFFSTPGTIYHIIEIYQYRIIILIQIKYYGYNIFVIIIIM